MEIVSLYHRLQFAFTITYHYLFPQLTMGLALLIVIMKVLALKKGDEKYNRSARFWAKIFAVNFLMGVVTGIPMEFQFGTNWARSSAAAGSVIGQTLGMESVIAFFLESSFLGLFLFGEKKLGQRGHLISAILVCVGAWMSGIFIVATNAWMQHPVGYMIGPDGEILLSSFWALLTNPWMIWQYFHTMIGAVITACFVVAAVGAYYLLNGRFEECTHVFLRIAVVVGLPATILMAVPTGDIQSKMVAKHQPATFAAMEGLFETSEGAPFPIFGIPDLSERKLNSRIEVPRLLSFMVHGRFDAEVKGLDAFPEEEWPDNIPLLFFSHQAMVMMGILFILVMMLSAWLLFKGRLFESKPVLWILMLMFPLPYIANTAGWTTAELGRQPYLIYGLMRTEEGFSHTVTSGSTIFTLVGFISLYILLSILFLFFISREIRHGPGDNTGMIGIANTPDSNLTAEQE